VRPLPPRTPDRLRRLAQVWEATDLVLGRRVAVKVLHPHLAVDDALVARFRQEAVAAARLSHPGIVGVYDTCSDGVNEAIVMELLDASTLRQHLDEHGPLDAETTVRIALRLLDALEAAHRAGLVHRDVKPSNILLCRDGRVKIADFGIAKADDQTELTQEGTLVGTATYLAPEQLLGGDVDGRTDLYSLGIVLYECLTGRVPFRGETGAAVALARLHSDPVDPRRVRADVPVRLSVPIMRVLSREPDQRFDSAADLRAALLDTGVPPATPAPEPLPPVHDEPTAEAESFARSERGWLVPALFILLIATAITVAGLLLRETAIGSDDGPATTSSTAAPTTTAVPLSQAVPFDPQGKGRPGENDELAANAIDGDTGPPGGRRPTRHRTSSGPRPAWGSLVVAAPTEAVSR
jgi:serine/threonine-protein kinase